MFSASINNDDSEAENLLLSQNLLPPLHGGIQERPVTPPTPQPNPTYLATIVVGIIIQTLVATTGTFPLTPPTGNSTQPKQEFNALVQTWNGLKITPALLITLAALFLAGIACFFWHEIKDIIEEITPKLKQKALLKQHKITYNILIPALIAFPCALSTYLTICSGDPLAASALENLVASITFIPSLFVYQVLYGDYITLMLIERDILLADKFLPEEIKNNKPTNPKTIFYITLILSTALTTAPQTLFSSKTGPFKWYIAIYMTLLESILHASHMAVTSHQIPSLWRHLTCTNKTKAILFSLSHSLVAGLALLKSLTQRDKRGIIIGAIALFTEILTVIPEAIIHANEHGTEARVEIGPGAGAGASTIFSGSNKTTHEEGKLTHSREEEEIITIMTPS